MAFSKDTYPPPARIPGAGGPQVPLYAEGGRMHEGDGDVRLLARISGGDPGPQGGPAAGLADIKISIARGAAVAQVGLEGGERIRELGVPGTYELRFAVSHGEGPHEGCPAEFDRDGDGAAGPGEGCVLAGDTVTAEYRTGDGPAAAASASFGLHDGLLLTDRPTYIPGSEMVLSLADADLDLDGGAFEAYPLGLVTWNYGHASAPAGSQEGQAAGGAASGPEPPMLVETGPDTGVFLAAVRVPSSVGGEAVGRGGEMVLEYADRGPGGASYPGQEERISRTAIAVSEFEASVSFGMEGYVSGYRAHVDVNVTAHVPSRNLDPGRIDRIGGPEDPLAISTRVDEISGYILAETGPDTGVFEGRLTIVHYGPHGTERPGLEGALSPGTRGPTGGAIAAMHPDMISVSYGLSDDEELTGSAMVDWGPGSG